MSSSPPMYQLSSRSSSHTTFSSISDSASGSPTTPTSSDAVTTPEPVEYLKLDTEEVNRRFVGRFERPMGDTEASYYLPSRESGVNDMYLHLGFTTEQQSLVDPLRFALVWSIMRLRHPLLAAKVEMHGYDDVRFVYNSHASAADALEDAKQNLEFRTQTKDELIDSYLNGPRTLSNERLSYFIVSNSKACDTTQNVDILLCAAHFIGDGMALHTFANQFFEFLGGKKSTMELEQLMEEEWLLRWSDLDQAMLLPDSIEQRLPQLPIGKFYQAATRLEYEISQNKLIGGHTFPKVSGCPRHTIVPTVPIDEERTKKMLKTCKLHGVSISAALFAICNIAWARTCPDKRDLPIMMYSAINLRSQLTPSPSKLLNDSYFFISIGYFNVVLPSFFPSTAKACEEVQKTFWHRARLAKEQSTVAAKHPTLIPRTREMTKDRGVRARQWAKEDDDIAAGLPKPKAPSATPSVIPPRPKAPSAALIGLSLLGPLDTMYKHVNYPDIKFHTLTTGSRQRSGGMLVFGYTFVNKLWVSLGYDQNGFDKAVVETFWNHVLNSMDEMLLE